VPPGQRIVSIPAIEYPDDLPIVAQRETLVRMISEHRVLVVCGETGSGKSTQLPKFCLEAGLGRAGMIGHTQPRRLAARSIAARLAEELGTVGDSRVAYKIRFGDQTSDQTLVKLMTDGILLAETQSDRDLRAYDAIIIDEAHERSLNIDFLLGYLRRLIDRRPELRVIITSATIDAGRFADHFADAGRPAPIVTVEGRGFPVELRYLPWNDVATAEDDYDDCDLPRHVIAGIDQLVRIGTGDILVFLPTERDIREVSHRAAGHFKRLGLAGRVDLLPLYARLPQAEQQRIFHPTGNLRRIIFATNVAESSLTVPGIRYVVDSGTARISRYSPRSRVQRLPIEAVSRASCDQRAGRCGRVAPGICVRLYSESDYESRDPFTTPELRRTNLAAVILQTLCLKLGDIHEFPFIDPPRPDAIRQGYRTLRELGAVDEFDRLTELGRRLGRLPVDPRVGRMILAGDEFGVLPEVLVIAAAIEIQDPRERPPDRREAADQAQAKFLHPRSDFLSYLKLWRFYHQQRDAVSRSRLDRVCRANFLSPQRMREWGDVYRQLRELAGGIGTEGRRSPKGGSIGQVRFSEDEDQVIDAGRYATLHQALLTGLLTGVAMAGDQREYTGAGGLKLQLWPGSGVFAAKPKWIVAGELVETSRLFARTVAAVQPEWIEPLAGHLVKRNFSDPHWSAKAGAAMCYEQVSLFGLPIVSRRRLPLAPIDPGTARELLIEEGLVGDELPTTARSVRFNRQLAGWIGDLAAKTRRRDLVIDPLTVRDFYATRLPEFVCDRVRLEKYDRDWPPPAWTRTLKDPGDVAAWLESPPPVDPHIDSAAEPDFPCPFMRPEELVPEACKSLLPAEFPDELVIGETRLPLNYRFEPGDEEDGIRVTVHRSALAQISDDRLGWLVPGLLDAKLLAMIKSLPKRLRRNLVPAADVVNKVVLELSDRQGQVPFLATVCEVLSREAQTRITSEDFARDKLPAHFEFLVRVVDDEGRTITQTRGVEQARAEAGIEAVEEPETLVEEAADWQRSGLTDFEPEMLPEQVVRVRGGVRVAQFPAFCDEATSVQTRLFADRAMAERQHRRGLVRLFALTQQKELRSQVRHLPSWDQVKMKLAPVLPVATIEQAFIDLLARRAFVEGTGEIRTREAFRELVAQRGRRIAEAACEIGPWLPAFAEAFHQARRQWEGLSSQDRSGIAEDVRLQVEGLTWAGFLSGTPWEWLRHYPRYFQAIAFRLEKYRAGGVSRDTESMRVVQDLWRRWLAKRPAGELAADELPEHEYRWLMEELRVSLFAQPLGTSVKVSPQRCEKLLQSATG